MKPKEFENLIDTIEFKGEIGRFVHVWLPSKKFDADNMRIDPPYGTVKVHCAVILPSGDLEDPWIRYGNTFSFTEESLEWMDKEMLSYYISETVNACFRSAISNTMLLDGKTINELKSEKDETQDHI